LFRLPWDEIQIHLLAQRGRDTLRTRPVASYRGIAGAVRSGLAALWSRANGVGMRTALLPFIICLPVAACSAHLVTSPQPVVTTPDVVSILGASPVVNSSANPPAAKSPTLRIRGASSGIASSPLMVVNGVVVSSHDITSDDIETVEIIKGLAAATLYSPLMRGCPPIVITTRRVPNATPARP
jgi:hypothetical protein